MGLLLLRMFGVGVYLGCLKPDCFSDQNMPFFGTLFQTWPLKCITFSDLFCRIHTRFCEALTHFKTLGTKWLKSSPYFRVKGLKSHALLARHTYIAYTGMYISRDGIILHYFVTHLCSEMHLMAIFAILTKSCYRADDCGRFGNCDKFG